jgi:hypothetical protein
MSVHAEESKNHVLKQEFLTALLNSPVSHVASCWILERVPFMFDGDLVRYIEWKHNLASKLEIDSGAIVLTGSACVGLSLNPYKNFRPFGPKSDIDVAVISDYYFNEAWRYLRSAGSAILRMEPRARQAVKDHVSKYIYWGTIATDRILPYLHFGGRWQKALQEMSKEAVSGKRDINVRIYKDWESLRYYQTRNLTDMRNALLSPGDET